jgi:Zinc binding domain
MHKCCSAACETDLDMTLCRICGHRGQRLSRRTIENMLTPESLSRLETGDYFFDTSPDCEVVYFSNESHSYFSTRDMNVRVGIKETQDPIPLCYCFGHTLESVRAELKSTGRSTVAERISQEIGAGNCACEVKNPSGRCCLGEVNRAVNVILLRRWQKERRKDSHENSSFPLLVERNLLEP